MKKLFFFISVFLTTNTIIAQNNEFRYGLKVGISVGKIAILPAMQHRTEHYGMGVVAGGVLEIPILKKLKVQIEPLYNLHLSSLRFNYDRNLGDPKKTDLSLHQVSVPIQLGYFIVPKLSVNAGVSANYNFYFANKVTLDYWASPETYYAFNITEEVTRFQPGALGGITIYATDHIFIDGRYHRMLTNSYKRLAGDNWTEYQHGFFQVAIGYRF